MEQQETFHFGRINVFTAADDHVFHTPDDPHGAVTLKRCKVSRVQPSLGIDRLRGLLRHAVIAAHQTVAADQQFALLSCISGTGIGVPPVITILSLVGTNSPDRNRGSSSIPMNIGGEPMNTVPCSA